MSLYVFHEDPGHGWLEVERTELRALGIADKITAYSYQRSGKVFLEEDQDLTTFMLAKQARGEKVNIVERYEDPTPIRGYASYVP